MKVVTRVLTEIDDLGRVVREVRMLLAHPNTSALRGLHGLTRSVAKLTQLSKLAARSFPQHAS